MVIRRISAGEGLPGAECSPTYRRLVPIREGLEVNRVDESSRHVDLKRRRGDIVTWSGLNLLLVVVVVVDAYGGSSEWLWRVGRLVTGVVCACNVVYYGLAYLSVRREIVDQKWRLSGKEESEAKKRSSRPLDFVRYQPHDESVQVPPYWRSFNTIFDSFKRMTARNRIAFFPSRTVPWAAERSAFEASPPPVVQPATPDVRFMFTETLSKYKGKIITTADDLRRYLSDHHTAEENEFVKTSEDLSFQLHQDNSGAEFWSARRRPHSDNCMDVSPLLRRSEYQISPNTSDSSVSSPKEAKRTNSEFFALLRDRHRIESSSFIYWISNFRMWMSKVVLGRVIEEMAVVNNGLRSLRLTGVTIGNVGLETLEDAGRNPSLAHQLPSLNYLLPFLRVSPKQRYLVERLTTLAQGHGMVDFKWSSGGELADGSPWERGLPTDAELLAHLFVTYLDQQLPLTPNSPNTSKPFSSAYLLTDDSAKSAAAAATKLAIVRQSLSPPHYNLLVDGALLEVPPGRNNLFSALVLFLHCVKVVDRGMLGRISLGKHGIDMLWIIDDRGL